MSDRSVAEILEAANQALATAELGLADVESSRVERRLPGAMNLAVFGRSVTNILQNLRSAVPDFDSWYSLWVEEMRADPLLRYFYTLRSEVLKEGRLAAGKKATVTFHSDEQLIQLLGPPPPGTFAMVAVNQDGESGWMIRLQDGTEQFYAVALPAGMASVTFHVPKPPSTHLGRLLTTDNFAELGRLYCSYLRRLIDSAAEKFDVRRPER